MALTIWRVSEGGFNMRERFFTDKDDADEYKSEEARLTFVTVWQPEDKPKKG